MYQNWYTARESTQSKAIAGAVLSLRWRTGAGAAMAQKLRGTGPKDHRRRYLTMSSDVEFSWPIGMPLVRSLGRELWEVRSSLPRGRIARVIFCVEKDYMVLLHGFIKKTQKTPKQEIDLALKRKKGTQS
jgi:phage-related protein